MGLTHFEEAPATELSVGHLRARWSALGQAAGSERVGVRRIEVADGGWSTPAHEHGAEEEIFYVLDGRGLLWHAGAVCEIRRGDCILFKAGRGAHTVHGVAGLDLLAFGSNVPIEAIGFPRLGISLFGNRAVESVEGRVDGLPIQFVREAKLGPPELSPKPGARPASVVNLEDVEPIVIERDRVTRARRDLGTAAGSRTTGLQHFEVAQGKLANPLHCHSLEEEIFVVLDGDGVLLLDDDETPVRAGNVVARPAATGVAHTFRAGEKGMTMLAYGNREPGDACFYPRSGKISFRGLGVIGRLEQLDYWDGE